MKTIVGVLLVFVLGWIAGTLTASIYFAHRTTLFLSGGTPAFVELVQRRLTKGLHLDAGQKSQVYDILMSNISQRKELQKQIQPQIQKLNQESVRQIRAILHPDQMDAFQHNLEVWRHNHPRMNLSPPAPAANPAASDATNAPAPAPATHAPIPGNP